MNGSSGQHPSRRKFLASTIVSAMSIAASRGVGPVSRDQELLYVGTYTEGDNSDGIHLVRFNTETGELRRVAGVNAGPNPSFLAIHPRGHTLYAVNETTEWEGRTAGGVTVFDIAPASGELTKLGQQSSEGGAPCYISVDRAGRVALVANYVAGSIAVLPIRDGTLDKATHVVQHAGKGPNAERQEGPHAHCIVTDPSNRFVLAADLGIDRVLVYRLRGDEGRLQHVAEGDAVLQAGAGPRHLAFHPTLPLVYVANELDSTVSTFRFDAVRGVMTAIASIATLPARWTGSNYPADVHIAPSGRHLYLSNRGHNSIAVYSVADLTGALTLQQHIATEGDWPRNFSLDPSGNWLLVANQRSGSVVVLRRDQDSGRLWATGTSLGVPRAVCLRFRAHVGVTT